jgi:hypothetical protein
MSCRWTTGVLSEKTLQTRTKMSDAAVEGYEPDSSGQCIRNRNLNKSVEEFDGHFLLVATNDLSDGLLECMRRSAPTL